MTSLFSAIHRSSRAVRDTLRYRAAALRAWYAAHEVRIVIAIGMILSAAMAFGAGVLTSPVWQDAPMVVEHAAAVSVSPTATETAAPAAGAAATPADCMFVGSRNSTKYYPPTCSFAKRIAPENLRCFISAEDAEAQGYVRSTGC